MMTSSAIPRQGYFFAVLAAVFWAISGSSAKFLFNEGISPLQLVQLRVTLASGLLFPILYFRNRSLLRISPKDILYFAVLGIAGMAMVQFTYFFTISKIKVAAAILLQYLAPTFIALYTILFAHEKLTRLILLAVAGATTGCYLVVGAYNFDLLALNRVGLISGICAAVAFAFYSIYGESGMRRYDPWTVLFYALVFAALFWNTACFLWDAAPSPFASLRHPYSPVQWALILYIVVLGTIVPFGLYFVAINLIRSTRASITATLEPITAGVISYIFLGEVLDSLQLLGGMMVIASVIILQVHKEYDDKTPALIRMRSQQVDSTSVIAENGPDYHSTD